MADEGIEPLQVYTSRDISGGLNTWFHPIDVPDNETVELQNIDTSGPGIRKKRPGTTLSATGITAGPIYGLGALNGQLLAVSEGHEGAASHKRLWKWDGTGAQWTYVGPLTGYTAQQQYTVTQAFDVASGSGERIAIINGASLEVKRWYYNNALVTQAVFGAAQPKGAALEYHANRGLVSGSVTGGSTVENVIYASSYASPVVTGPANLANVFMMGGDSDATIVAIRGFRSSEAIIFLNDRIEVLLMTENAYGGEFGIAASTEPYSWWSRQTIDGTIGAGSRHAIAKVSEDLFFVDQKGNVRSLARTALDASQGTKSLPLSMKIQSYIDRINGTYLGRTVAIAYDRFYIVAFPLDNATWPSHTFVYDTVRSSWDGPWIGWNPVAMKALALSNTGAVAADRLQTVYIGTDRTAYGEVLRLYRGTSDAGNTFEYQETTKRWGGETIDLDKTFVRIEILGVATADVDLTIEANVDAKGWITIGTANVLGDAPQLPVGLPFVLGGTGIIKSKHTLEMLPRGRDIQLRFSADTIEDIQILGYKIFYFVENLTWED